MVNIAKERYLSDNPSNMGADEVATFDQLARYFPVTIVRGGEPEIFGGMPMVTPEDLGLIAGGPILSYGRFYQSGDVLFK